MSKFQRETHSSEVPPEPDLPPISSINMKQESCTAINNDEGTKEIMINQLTSKFLFWFDEKRIKECKQGRKSAAMRKKKKEITK